MKVIAINGSPRMEKGYTTLILTPFILGMMNARAEVKLFYTRQLKKSPVFVVKCTVGIRNPENASLRMICSYFILNLVWRISLSWLLRFISLFQVRCRIS